MFCKHKWNKVIELITESKFEQITKQKEIKIDYDGSLTGLTDKKFICILQCENCGKLDKTVIDF